MVIPVGTLGKMLGRGLVKMTQKSHKVAHVKEHTPSIWHPHERMLHRMSKLASDPRYDGVWQKWDAPMSERIAELPKVEGVSPAYVESLVKGASNAKALNVILRYLKSSAADNIDRWERAQLASQVLEKLRWLGILHMFQ